MSVTSLKYGTLDGFLLVAVDDLRVPSKAGNDGKFLSLSSGSLSWSAAGTGLPGAPDFSVQYNDGAGGFGGDGGFLYDPATNTATLGIASSELGYLELCNDASGFTTKLRAGSNDLSYTWIFPTDVGTAGYVLSTNGSNPIITYWQSVSSLITDAVIKAPDFDGRNDIQATDDYNPLRILEFVTGQTTNAFEIQYWDSGTSSFINGLSSTFKGILRLGHKAGFVSAEGSQQGELVLYNSGGASGSTTSIVGGSGGNTWTLQLPNSAGTADYVLTTNGSGVTSWTDVTTLVTTLQYWTENFYDTGVNAFPYSPVTEWIPNDITSDICLTLELNAGALLVQVPDGTTTGGNKRGPNAIDFCALRTAADQVASGTASMQGGVGNKTVGTYSFTYGQLNENLGSLCYIFGENSTTDSSQNYQLVVGGYGVAYLYGQWVHSAGAFSSAGDAQGTHLVWKCRTTNNTIREMFLDADAGIERATLPNYTTWSFNISIAVHRTDGTERDTFEATGGIYRNDTNLSTTLIYQNVIQHGSTGVVITISADTTNGSLRLQVTGESSKNYNVVAYGRIAESAGVEA